MAGRSAIGLDIGTSGVRAAEVSFARGGVVVLEKFGQVALPTGAVRDGEVVDTDTVAAKIRELWGATGFSHKKVILGVANQRVVVRQIDLPYMAPADLKKSLPYQVQEYLPMPVDEAVLDFHEVESVEVNGDRGMRGMLVAASRESVMTNVRCAQAAGLRPLSVDLTSFAVLRSMGTRLDPNVETEAIVDIGARVTNIVVHSNGVPQFVRILLMGGQDITDSICERAGFDPREAEGIKQQLGLAGSPEWEKVTRVVDQVVSNFVDEIRGSLDYAASKPDSPIARVVITGGGSKLAGLGERLSIATRLPVILGQPIAGMPIGNTGLSDEQLTIVQPLAAVPVGLALGAA